MSANKIGDLFHIGADILGTSIDSNTHTILAQLGDVVTGTVYSDNAELWQTPGIASRPRNPTAGKTSAQAIAIRESDRDIIIATRDVDSQTIYGNLKPGETSIYAPGSDGTAQGRIILKDDGSVNLFTKKDNEESGAGIGIFIDPATEQISLVNSKGYGIIIGQDGITITAKDSSLSLNADGSISLIGKAQTQIDGSSVILGSIAVPVVNSALIGPTGIVGVASTKVLIALS